MDQLSLNLEPGLAQRYRDMRECFASCVYARGLGRVAAAIDQQPSNLSAMLSGSRHLDTECVERYMDAFDDNTPALYWAAKHCQDAEQQQRHALSVLPGLVEQLSRVMAAANATAEPRRRR
jgi:hypothetical protein